MREVVMIGSEQTLGKNVMAYLEARDCQITPAVQWREKARDFPLAAVLDATWGAQRREPLLALVRRLPVPVPIFVATLDCSATELAAALPFPDHVIGFSPLILDKMKILEVSRPLQQGEQTVWEKGLSFWRAMGKDPLVVPDHPGLVFPRMLSVLVNEAVHLMDEEVASPAVIDVAMRHVGAPQSLLAWADALGLPVIVAILRSLAYEQGERYRPSPTLIRMVQAGYWGQETGRGFYSYEEDGTKLPKTAP